MNMDYFVSETLPVTSFTDFTGVIINPDCVYISSYIINPLKTETANRVNEAIKDVIFNDPATIVLWKDGTKTVVKTCNGDVYNKEVGLMACIVKKLTGNTGRYNEIFKKWISD